MILPLFAEVSGEGGWFTAATDTFLQAYQSGMRNSMFTGFLTLCGFLMSAKTFIVVNMKKEVYEKDIYQGNFKVQSRLPNKDGKRGESNSPEPRGVEYYKGIFAPLQSLADWLLANVVMSLATSVSQFTVGFIPHWIAALFCVVIALATVIVLGFSLHHIRFNLNTIEVPQVWWTRS